MLGSGSLIAAGSTTGGDANGNTVTIQDTATVEGNVAGGVSAGASLRAGRLDSDWRSNDLKGADGQSASYDFKATNSSRTRLGVRFIHAYNDRGRVWADAQ